MIARLFARLLAAGAVASALAVAACSTTCTATNDKLANLRRGMTAAEATQVMGCSGQPVAPATPGEGFSSLAWQGPGTVATETQLDFEAGRLLWYVTVPRGAL
ncbi:MAG: hypothetical protein LCH95_09345 [Proteobacteria bacterium]|nr:hypothetical protein [Pseudomonadota bacterium]